MKTVEIELNGVNYSITAMNAHDATYWTIQMMPVIASLQIVATSNSDSSSLASALSGLSKQKYTDIVTALFEGIKKNDHGVTASIIRDGAFMYDDVKSDAYIYLSLLKESFMLNFKDFLVSAAKVFPAAAAILSTQSSTQASETI